MQMKKRLQKYRFILLLILFICIFQLFSIIFIYSSTGEEKDKYTPIEKYEQVYIRRGDTLWEIAKEYKPKNQSINQYASYIKNFNHMSSDDIYAGEAIVVPVFKER